MQGIVLSAVLDDNEDDPIPSGTPVIITSYLSDVNVGVATGTEKSFGVAVGRKEKGDVGRAVAIVTSLVDKSGKGSVCVSGCCPARVYREDTSPVLFETKKQLTGVITADKDYFEIGENQGDVDILWEEESDDKERWAYVSLPCGSQEGVLSLNSSGEVIPPHSAMEVTGKDNGGALVMGKPSEDDLEQIFLSPAYPIPENTFFYAFTPERGEVVITSPPDIGKGVGTKEDEWEMFADMSKFLFLGESNGLSSIRTRGGSDDFTSRLYMIISVSGGTCTAYAVNADGTTFGDPQTFQVFTS